jgi:hypothetical protein
MEILLFWFVCAIVVGLIAGSRGRNGFGWFLLAMVISPLLAGILAIALPNLRRSGSNSMSGILASVPIVRNW